MRSSALTQMTHNEEGAESIALPQAWRADDSDLIDSDRDTADQPDEVEPPAPSPCGFCPYRRDAPSGIWAPAEYDKLRAFDADTALQPKKLFVCHLTERNSGVQRLCAGWTGCHSDALLGLRWALITGEISAATFRAAVEYRSPVPLFASGAEAADHGQADIEDPSPAAAAAIAKIMKRRPDIT